MKSPQSPYQQRRSHGLNKSISGTGQAITSQYQLIHRTDIMDTRNTELRVQEIDQLNFLLEYLQQDVEMYSYISEESYQPLDLSMKKKPESEVGAIFSNLKSPLSTSSPMSNSNTENPFPSISPISNSSSSESSQCDFDLSFFPSPGSPW